MLLYYTTTYKAIKGLVAAKLLHQIKIREKEKQSLELDQVSWVVTSILPSTDGGPLLKASTLIHHERCIPVAYHLRFAGFANAGNCQAFRNG